MDSHKDAMVKLRERFMQEVYMLADASASELKQMGERSVEEAIRRKVKLFRQLTGKILGDM